MLSPATAQSTVVPDTVSAGHGLFSVTLGTVTSAGLATVTVTSDEVVALPAASRAREDRT